MDNGDLLLLSVADVTEPERKEQAQMTRQRILEAARSATEGSSS